MKKVFIGLLLIVAAGAGIFYFVRKQSKKDAFDRDLIVGNWRLTSFVDKSATPANHSLLLPESALSLLSDSALKSWKYEFRKDSSLVIPATDSSGADHLQYRWKDNQILIMDNATDSSGGLFTVNRLTSDSLTVQSPDSTVVFFFVKTK